MIEKVVRFYDTTGRHMTINYCDFIIKVNYSENEINYIFDYNYFDNNDKSGSPFNQIDLKYKKHKDGLVINRNSLSELLTDYLLMDHNELSKYTGNITPMSYKLIILKTICELW